MTKSQLKKLVGKDEMKRIIGTDKRNRPGMVYAERPKFPFIFFLPDFNLKYNGLVKQHWTIADRYKKGCLMALAVAGLNDIEPIKKKFKMVFTRLRRKGAKPMDDDNLRGSFKYLRDQFEEKNWIFSDGPNWIETEYHDRKPESDEAWGVKIEISEV